MKENKRASFSDRTNFAMNSSSFSKFLKIYGMHTVYILFSNTVVY